MNRPSDVIDTPAGIQLFRLLALRGALKLEILGMKRRGNAPSARSIVCQLLGLLPKTKGREALAALEFRLEQIRERGSV